MTDINDPRWIHLKPSTTNLILTLTSAVLACGVLWLIDIEDWMRAIILLLALIVLAVDVYVVRFKSRDAIAAFYLIERDVVSNVEGNASPVTSKQLWVRIRFLNTHKRKTDIEIEAQVHKAPYVSTYFSTIPYTLPNDPKWRRWLPRVISLWGDSLDREAFRQVRVQLKWRPEV
ncbi:MAG: hypothetical protein HC782_05050 [Gammaproteobacteria bacterium]|nr:hypothetical protein [Gammaproteobacteria bacterium]